MKASLSPAKRRRAAIQQPQADAALTALIDAMVATPPSNKTVLVIDVGGTSVKILASGQTEVRSFQSGRKLTPDRMVSAVKKLAANWKYEVVSVGYPGPVLAGQPTAEPPNLGQGWVEFDFAAAFGRPVKVVNDAAMQALGSYNGGKMLFLGLGTGLGSALIVDGAVEPMELGHLPYRKHTYETYVGRAGFERASKRKWRRRVADVVERLTAALQPDETVIGGGNVRNLDPLPPRCRAGHNANAFRGGFRLWAKGNAVAPHLPPRFGRRIQKDRRHAT
jgi:polyphosphate glucokinase